MVKYSADSLLRLINDILDFSKIEARKLSLGSIAFNLRVSLEQTLKTFRPRAERKGLALICRAKPDVPMTIIGDPVRLRQIVSNLIDNAIKFTERGKIELAVELEWTAPDEVAVELCVTDTGIGIPVEKQELIFAAFTQADGSTTQFMAAPDWA